MSRRQSILDPIPGADIAGARASSCPRYRKKPRPRFARSRIGCKLTDAQQKQATETRRGFELGPGIAAKHKDVTPPARMESKHVTVDLSGDWD